MKLTPEQIGRFHNAGFLAVSRSIIIQLLTSILTPGASFYGFTHKRAFRMSTRLVLARPKASCRDGRWSTSLGPVSRKWPIRHDYRWKEHPSTAKYSIQRRLARLGSNGLSNMEAPLRPDDSAAWRGVNNWSREVSSANFPKMRLFNVHHNIALQPNEDVESNRWVPVTPETTKTFSAVAYLFGREMHQRYHAPIQSIPQAPSCR